MNHWKSRGPILSSQAALPPCQQASRSLCSQLHLRTPSLGPLRSAVGCHSQRDSPVLTTTPTPPSPTALQPTWGAHWPDSCSDEQGRTLCPHSSPDSRGCPRKHNQGQRARTRSLPRSQQTQLCTCSSNTFKNRCSSQPACHTEESLVSRL